jgi:hypothetical protein
MRCIGLVAVLLLAGAAAAEEPAGWQVTRDGSACEADFPQNETGAMLTIAVMPPQHMLLLQHPDFPAGRQTQKLALAFDGAAPLVMEGLGSDHIYGIAITPDIAMGLRTGTALRVALGNKTYSFAYAHADQAMDEAAHCAGTKTLPETWAEAPKPIPTAPGWGLIESIGGTAQCSVRRNSPQVNTSLVLTKEGKLLLIAGRPDWAKWGDQIAATLKIDGDAPIPVAAAGVQNLVLLPLTDVGVTKKVEGARTLGWHLPWGDFTAEVEGLGTAEVALRECDARHEKHTVESKR